MQNTTAFAAAAMQPAPQFSEQEQLRCPRCDSTNTKFCYYNNYNLSQPRHFCKSCRRYWTKGGALRNIPVGGSSRKSTKRAAASSSTTTADSPASKRPSVATTAGPSGRISEPKPEPDSVLGSLGLEMPVASFTSLLVTDGQLGSLLEGIGPGMGAGFTHGPSDGGSQPGGCWGTASFNGGSSGGGGGGSGGGVGWPDLAIFTTPSSGFQ